MIIVLSILALLAIIFAVATIFLLSEFAKKFIFMNRFIDSSPLLRQYYYAGNKALGIKKGMRNIVLYSKNADEFSALIGLQLKMFGLTGYDYYGYASSQKPWIVFRIYLGSGQLLNQFLLNKNIEVFLTSTEEDQKLIPDAIYPPHWWQRLGLWS